MGPKIALFMAFIVLSCVSHPVAVILPKAAPPAFGGLSVVYPLSLQRPLSSRSVLVGTLSGNKTTQRSEMRGKSEQ